MFRAQRAIGRTKIFLSDPAHKMMEKERINGINSGVIFSQSKLRMKAACDSFCQQRQAIVSLNVLAKTCVYNAFWRRIKTMAPRNQRAFRRAKAAKTMFYMRSAQVREKVVGLLKTIDIDYALKSRLVPTCRKLSDLHFVLV